ncbi:hypothetical protein PYW08_011679 [Mythimna loreyi]|uniref:Uncharacterized protein n=1 Tax=Mythimna loreyi TaxID=667449 RepID=A0ACC2QKL5_9NEOP|nr:hypothetical protein PYW08_011679 [Mythimna loreyi]
MEGFCRGCLIKYDEPMELLQYTEKNRRLFVYSTGLQVKRNDAFPFQLCKDCFLNMKQACKFKKNCRTSDKRFRNYLALKDVGDPVDFCTFLKNSDDTLTFRLPMASGNSTPATQKCRDDDNESTCTSIRNFMTDILQGEEMPDTEARIIKEVIEEEADVLDDSLDSHWLQDDMSIDTDFRLDFSFSQFSTPRSVNDDRCYTPKQKDDQLTFETINTEKQTKILKDFTNAFKTDENIEELCIFVGGTEQNKSFENLKELSPFGVNEIDGIGKSDLDSLKNKTNLKELISDLDIDEIDGMDTSDSKTVETNEHIKELRDFGMEDINTIHNTTDTNKKLKELCNFDKDEINSNRETAVRTNKSLKEFITNFDLEEIEGIGKNSNKNKSNQLLKEIMGNLGKDSVDTFGKQDNNDSKSNRNLECLSAAKKAKSLKEICDIALDNFEDTVKTQSNTFKISENVKELRNLSFENEDFENVSNTGIIKTKHYRDIKEICNFGIDGMEKSEINLDLPSLSDALETNNTDIPDFDIPQSVIGSMQSNNDVSNSSINIEAFLKGTSEKNRIDTPDFQIPKSITGSIQSNNENSNSSLNIEALLKGTPKDRIDTPDFDIPKGITGSIQSNNDASNSSINVEALLKVTSEKGRIDTPDFDIPKGITGSIQSNNDASNSSINIKALLKGTSEKGRTNTPDFDIPKGLIGAIQSNNEASNSSKNFKTLLKGIAERDSIGTPDFDIPIGVMDSIQSSNDVSNSSINIEALLKGKPEKVRIDTPDFDIPKGVIDSIRSNNDVSNSSDNVKTLLRGIAERDRIDTPDFDIPKGVIDSIQANNDASNSSINIEALLKGKPEKVRIDTPDFDIPKSVIESIRSNNDVSNSSDNVKTLLRGIAERDRIDTPDFDIPKGVIDSIQSNNDASNSSINIEALLKGKPEKVGIDTPDYDIPKSVIGSIHSNNDVSNSSINIEALLRGKPEKGRIDTPDFEVPKGVIDSIRSNNDVSNSSDNIKTLLRGISERVRIDTPDFDIPKGVIGSIRSYSDASNSSNNIKTFLKGIAERDRVDTPDFDIPKGVIGSIRSYSDASNSSNNIKTFLKGIAERDRVDTPDFDIPKGVIGSVRSNNDISNSSINIEALLKDKPCSIDKNLQEALKNTDSKEFSLDDLLVSPPVFANVSAGSTPTITNILFGENLDTSDTKIMGHSIESYQGDIEIFEEFFQNDTKEFDLEDIKRENGGFKPGDWKKHIAVNDFEVANKENDSKNIEIEISVDDKDKVEKTIKKIKTEPMVHIPQDEENDKFIIKYLYCKLCDIRYDTSRAFSVHFAKKHNIKIVKQRKPNIKKNKADVTKIKVEDTINIYDTPATDKFDLEKSFCKLCNIQYESNKSLSIHFTKTHRIKIEKPKPVKVNKNHELLCNNCGKKSRDRTNFARHVKKCGQKAMVFECDRCKLEFTTQANLEKHQTCHTQMKIKKETGKEFVCTICGRTLHKHCNFLLHMRRHKKDYSAQCDQCDKKFYRETDLKTHLRQHSGETPFACKFCQKTFARKDVLLRHILIHLDERLYQCDYCNKKFIKKCDLIKHIKNESCRRITKAKLRKMRKTGKKKKDTNVPEENNKKKHEQKETVNEVTIIYTKGSDDTIKKQLPFLETERSN